jgi:hypothetical protein
MKAQTHSPLSMEKCPDTTILVTTRQQRYEQTEKARVRRARYKAKLKAARRAARLERNRARSIDTFGFYSGPKSSSVGVTIRDSAARSSDPRHSVASSERSDSSKVSVKLGASV